MDGYGICYIHDILLNIISMIYLGFRYRFILVYSILFALLNGFPLKFAVNVEAKSYIEICFYLLSMQICFANITNDCFIAHVCFILWIDKVTITILLRATIFLNRSNVI